MLLQASVVPAATASRERLAQILQRRVPERLYRQLTLVTMISIVALIGSGGWVRLSESGLGCPTWPKCYSNHLAAHDSYHALTEFANRCVITVVGVLVVLAFLGALRRRNPRRDLVWLSLAVVLGYVGEAVLGGITVLLKLAPELVAAHLVLAMAVLVVAVHLHWRAGEMGPRESATAQRAPTGALDVRLLARLMLAAITLVVILGTVATGSGPRAGSPDTPRFHFRFSSTVELHAIVGMFLFGLVVGAFFILRATDAPRHVRNLHLLLLAGLALQGVIGYAQYFTHLATGLVEIHIIGAALIVIALARFNLELGPPRITEGRRAPVRGRTRLAGVPVPPETSASSLP
jgi:cytochrome c oxidase assembly protein subunit 15